MEHRMPKDAETIEQQQATSHQPSPTGISRRAALGIAGGLAVSHNSLAAAVASKKRRKKGGKKGKSKLRVRFVRTWGRGGDENGEFDGPRGLSVAPNGDVYVADDLNNRVQVFDAEGTFLDQIPIDSRPLDVEVAASGEVFVTDRGDDERIERFSAGGTFLGSFGGPGEGDGQFVNLFALALGNNGDVYGTDVSLGRIQQFGADGGFIRVIGQDGNGEIPPPSPEALAATPNGDLFVADSGNFLVQRFSADGEFLDAWGSQGTGQGQFEEPSGIAVSPNGTVFVADAALHRIQAFTSTGKFLGQFGSEGSGDGQFFEPSGLAVSRNRQLYVADTGNNRIQQFALLKPKKKRKKGKR
jgi:tripartite motif-containing protein 71